jgi:GNAT superfamily N-acetyltransferase
MQVKVVSGKDIFPWLDVLASLRIEVFRAFPYLYEGNADYEKKYLKVYTQSDQTVLVLVLDGEKVVGASSGMPLIMESNEVKAPFVTSGFTIEGIFYFGESVLLEPYRGKGFGKVFFNEREKHAVACGFVYTTFCGVVRPDDHPLRPDDYRSLNNFWISRGYLRLSELTTRFTWKDIDQPQETEKEMMFWMKKVI